MKPAVVNKVILGVSEENVRLAADLATVTAERDRLREALAKFRDLFATGELEFATARIPDRLQARADLLEELDAVLKGTT